MKTEMRRFVLVRNRDVSGVSGTGVVAEGVEFSNGWCAMTWLSSYTSVVFYPSIKDVEHVHSHDGATIVQWLDSSPFVESSVAAEDPNYDHGFGRSQAFDYDHGDRSDDGPSFS